MLVIFSIIIVAPVVVYIKRKQTQDPRAKLNQEEQACKSKVVYCNLTQKSDLILNLQDNFKLQFLLKYIAPSAACINIRTCNNQNSGKAQEALATSENKPKESAGQRRNSKPRINKNYPQNESKYKASKNTSK